MSMLLDTHVLVWSAVEPERLGRKAKALLLDPEQALCVSSVSVLEIARLNALAQLRLASPVAVWCERARRAIGASPVGMDDAIAVEAYALPGSFHADPADRILVATARINGWRLMTADDRIIKYSGVRSIDARK